jgi:hypothetical protein
MKIIQLNEARNYSEIIDGRITPATAWSHDSYVLSSTAVKKVAKYNQLTELGDIFKGVESARDVRFSELENLTSLKGLPKKIDALRLDMLPKLSKLDIEPDVEINTVSITSCPLTSLKGLPGTIAGNLFTARLGQLNTFEGFPSRIGFSLSLDAANLNMSGIHKHIKSIGYNHGTSMGGKFTNLSLTPKGGVLGLLYIENLGAVSINKQGLPDIINKWLHETGSINHRMLGLQEELIDAGLEEYAHL